MREKTNKFDIAEQRSRYQPVITLEEIIASEPAGIYYSSQTCWWTHNPDHICGDEFPLDPSGAPLFVVENAIEFLKEAKENPDHYGKHGLEAFMAAHHQNVTQGNGKPVCFPAWDYYNRLIDIAKNSLVEDQGEQE